MKKTRDELTILTAGSISFSVSVIEETLTDDSKVYNVETLIQNSLSDGKIPPIRLEDNTAVDYSEAYKKYLSIIKGVASLKDSA